MNALKFAIFLLQLSILFTFINMEPKVALGKDNNNINETVKSNAESESGQDPESSKEFGPIDSSTVRFYSSTEFSPTDHPSTVGFAFSMENQKQEETSESNGPWKIVAIVSLSINAALLVFIAGAGAYAYKTTKSKATYGFPK